MEKVALDPHRGHYNAPVGGLDAPEVVVDAFHIVQLANTMVDEVRRRVQHEQLEHRGHKGDPLCGIRRLLLTGHERLSDTGRARLAAGLEEGDPDCEVWYAHLIKEQLRRVYRSDGLAEATVELDRFYLEVASDGLSNGVTEAVNGLVKRVKRIGHGFRNIDNYRLRLLLFCGGVDWQDAPTARIRGRSPGLIA